MLYHPYSEFHRDDICTSVFCLKDVKLIYDINLFEIVLSYIADIFLYNRKLDINAT